MPITLSVLWTSPEDAYYILRSYIPHGRLLNKCVQINLKMSHYGKEKAFRVLS